MAVPALATEESIRDVIERITAEGQLTRNSGTNSIKSLKEIIVFIADTLADTYNMMDEQLQGLVDASTANKFNEKENKVEGGRNTDTSSGKEGGFLKGAGEKAKAGIGAVGGIVSKLIKILAGPAILAFLYFLPEILDSKLFKESLKFIQETLIPLLTSFKDNILLPIVNFFGEGFANILEDINNPDMSFGDVVAENLPIIAATLGLLFRKQLLGLVTKFIPMVFTAVGGLLKAGFLAAIGTALSPVALIAIAVAAITGLLFAAFKMLDPEKQEAIKSTIMAIPGQIVTFFKGIAEKIGAFFTRMGENIKDKLLEGPVAIFSSIITAPLDLLRKAVGWILGKLGFDDSADALNDFEFSELFANLISSVVENFMKLIDWFKEKIKEYNPIEAVKKGIGKIGEFFGGGDVEDEVREDRPKTAIGGFLNLKSMGVGGDDEELDDEVRGEDGLTAKHRKEIRDYEARMQYFARLNARDSATQLDAPADELESRRAKVEQMRNERESKQSGGVNASVNAPTDNSVKSTTTVHVSKPNVRPVNEEQTFNGLNSVYG